VSALRRAAATGAKAPQSAALAAAVAYAALAVRPVVQSAAAAQDD